MQRILFKSLKCGLFIFLITGINFNSNAKSILYSTPISKSEGIKAFDFLLFNSSGDGGIVNSNQQICAGTAPNDLTLASYNGTILYWERSDDAGFSSPTSIANTSSVLLGTEIGNLESTTYFRAVVEAPDFSIVYSEYAIISITSTTWNGSTWSNGYPTSTTAAVISADFTTSGNSFSACTLTVNNNAIVIISSGDDVTLEGGLTIETGSSFTLENNATLFQIQNQSMNVGTISINRDSSSLKRLDYTLWSSPVESQNLFNFSPYTMANRFYSYNSDTNLYNVISSPETTVFDIAKGYLIRMPNNHPSEPTVWTGTFSGVPNNGDYYYTFFDGGVGQRFNLIGNPYPSPIDALSFIDNADNSNSITGTLYFWRKSNGSSSPSYCTWSSLGFVGNGEPEVYDPNGVIQVGQGFLVEGTGVSNVVHFTNEMRTNNHANQFFKVTNTIEKKRFWLNAIGNNGAFSQTMIGYMTGASNGVDARIDAKYINDGSIALASMIEDTPYAIQGRGLPFDSSDIVRLSFSATNSGNYSIVIDHSDDFFANGQPVYLRDLTTGTIHDLSLGAYNFSFTAGTSSDRFEIMYQLPQNLDIPVFNASQVIIYKNLDSGFVVDAGNTLLKDIKVFDISGRLLYEQKDINKNETVVNQNLLNDVLLVQITSIDGVMVTKKMIY
ncbi:hypothetical protein [Flavobacterium capsici]|uniref:T9SS sorting signal type C domain-containing protein n=1 Tax=Flavobacterium capsici TaxID=3075618 RepID=A0AA96F2Q7_9FLAO|nr:MULTISPECIES: hypothetical protein [unclassified Flavobacterium]WNM18873.1 hypothetical protein RN608_12775 [Flavobacterium sp. PMR2A8]WNM22923.1 hypothetical protein RN605_06075 [Flavobacterium sp. PMTSA4]